MPLPVTSPPVPHEEEAVKHLGTFRTGSYSASCGPSGNGSGTSTTCVGDDVGLTDGSSEGILDGLSDGR